MKICILGDTHFGMRGDSVVFHSFYEKFYKNIFFPYLEKNKIKHIYQLGDLFDRRKFINFNTLQLCKKYFFDVIKQKGMELHTLLGNHDIYYKNTLDVNSTNLLLNSYDNIWVYKQPTTIDIDGIAIDVVPWICDENENQIMEFIEKSKSQIIFGHFELSGFEMERGIIIQEGYDKDILKKYDVVLSGHYHHKSTNGQITYVGTPGEMTWMDYDDPRGFHVFDTETRELEFIQNPFNIFNRITYDDNIQTYDFWKKYNYEKLKDSYVKIVVINKKDPYLFDSILDNLYRINVIDISIVEDFTEFETPNDESVNEAEDTITILNRYIDSLTLQIKPDILKSIIKDLYIESMNMEKTQ